jgi:citrate synthase
MINRTLSSAEAAGRLGVKPATLYSYVSRGLLHPERSPRGSRFDLQEVVRLSRSARNPVGPAHPIRRERRGQPDGPEPEGRDPIFLTELTFIDGGRLYYRGMDAVLLSRTRTFEEVAGWLWTGDWAGAEAGAPWTVAGPLASSVRRAMAAVPSGAGLPERLMAAVVAASLGDDLRHDLSPSGVPVTGRTLLAVLADSLPGGRLSGSGPALAPSGPAETSDGESISSRVWRGLQPVGGAGPGVAGDAGIAALEAALVLAADHELAPSTMAARVAASFRADPYAVILTGLGPSSGSWYAGSTGTPSEVENLLKEAEEVGPERAVGDRLRRGEEKPHGFGMPLYPEGDPRGAELLCRLEGIGPPDRLEVVRGLVQLGRERGFAPPNFDLGLGALSFCAGLTPGAAQAIFTIGKVAGWLAHAMEEYSVPTRFRSRADYVGPPPEDRLES